MINIDFRFMDSNIWFYFIAGLSFVIGLFIFSSPQQAINVQKEFYKLINWNIEPISMEKEIRNTKGMGLFLLAFTLGMVIVYIFNQVRIVL